MLCPNPACADKQAMLLVADRQGIEIDYCPHCRGIWLDRGELEKLLERLGPMTSAIARQEPPRGRDDYPRHSHSNDTYRSDSYHSKRKHKSWVGDLFDFD